MEKKNIIYIIATVVVLLVVGYIIYRAFFTGNLPDTALQISVEEVAPVAPILTKGTALDFEPIREYNSQGQLFSYPKPTLEETGLPLSDLIR